MTHPEDQRLADQLTHLVGLSPGLVVEEIGRKMMLEHAAGMLRGRLWSALVIALATVLGPADPLWIAIAIAAAGIILWSISWAANRWVPRDHHGRQP